MVQPGECNHLQFLNLTEEQDADAYILRAEVRWTMLAVMYVILAVGVPGNLAFIFVVVRLRSMRTATNIYLLNLAVSDVLFLISSSMDYSFYYTSPFRSHLPTATFIGCIGSFMPHYITYFASISMVTLVTIERYRSICKPAFSRASNLGNGQNCRLILGHWVLAVGLAGLTMTRYSRLVKFCTLWPDTDIYRGLPVEIGFCTPINRWGLIVGHLLETVVFVVAMVLNVVMYALIINRLHTRVNNKRRQSQQLPAVSFVGVQEALQVRNKVTIMLVTNGVVFFLCQTPYISVSMGILLQRLSGVPSNATYRMFVFPLTISHVFMFVNAAVNPLIYNATNRFYRQAFVEALTCSKSKSAMIPKVKQCSRHY